MKIAKHPEITDNGICNVCGQRKYCYSALYENFQGRIDPVDGYCKDFCMDKKVEFKEIW